jgi:hypothetical protein
LVIGEPTSFIDIEAMLRNFYSKAIRVPLEYLGRDKEISSSRHLAEHIGLERIKKHPTSLGRK